MPGFSPASPAKEYEQRVGRGAGTSRLPEESTFVGDGFFMSGILTYKQVAALTGLHRASIWRAVRAGRFPAPVKLQGNRVGFVDSEVQDWIDARPRVVYDREAAA